MNLEKLKRLQAQVRIGGKGTPRRKKKVMHQTAATDDKKLQSSLKKLSVSTIPGIEEVNIIKDDLTVIHFNNPKAQASLSANTFAVTGHGETKKVMEMLPEILPQLGQETVVQLRMFANTMSSNQKPGTSGKGSAIATDLKTTVDGDDDDVPMLVNDFDEIAKVEASKDKNSTAASMSNKGAQEKSIEQQLNVAHKEEPIAKGSSAETAVPLSASSDTQHKEEKDNKKQKKQQKLEKQDKQEPKLAEKNVNGNDSKTKKGANADSKKISEPTVAKQTSVDTKSGAKQSAPNGAQREEKIKKGNENVVPTEQNKVIVQDVKKEAPAQNEKTSISMPAALAANQNTKKSVSQSETSPVTAPPAVEQQKLKDNKLQVMERKAMPVMTVPNKEKEYQLMEKQPLPVMEVPKKDVVEIKPTTQLPKGNHEKVVESKSVELASTPATQSLPQSSQPQPAAQQIAKVVEPDNSKASSAEANKEKLADQQAPASAVISSDGVQSVQPKALKEEPLVIEAESLPSKLEKNVSTSPTESSAPGTSSNQAAEQKVSTPAGAAPSQKSAPLPKQQQKKGQVMAKPQQQQQPKNAVTNSGSLKPAPVDGHKQKEPTQPKQQQHQSQQQQQKGNAKNSNVKAPQTSKSAPTTPPKQTNAATATPAPKTISPPKATPAAGASVQPAAKKSTSPNKTTGMEPNETQAKNNTGKPQQPSGAQKANQTGKGKSGNANAGGGGKQNPAPQSKPSAAVSLPEKQAKPTGPADLKQ